MKESEITTTENAGQPGTDVDGGNGSLKHLDVNHPGSLHTHRGLRPRHVQLAVIAGGIGVGLFVGVGKTLVNAGPLALLLGYLFYGAGFIWPCNLCTAEMVTWLPIRGSIFGLATRYVDPALGFALGWTYFYAGVMFVCTEASAVATVVQYWDVSNVNPVVWVAAVLVSCTMLNLIAVKWYGESEFFMSITKVFLITGLVLFTFITMVGGNPKHDAYGFRAWKNENAIHSYYAAGATGRLLSIAIAIRFAVFTLAGPDFISLSAGEIQNPRRTIPRLARLVFYRLVGIYLIGMLALGIICSSRDSHLIAAIKGDQPGAAASPWVIGIINAGVTGGLPGLINLLILVSGWSCGNAFVYSSSRTLYSLAQEGQAPRFFLKCSQSGIPYYCVLAVSLISCITFLVGDNAAITVFSWFVDLSTSGLIVNFTCFFWVYLGWYRALKAQGFDRRTLPYHCNFAPYTAWFGLVFGILIIIFLGFDSFAPFSIQGFVTTYFGVFWCTSMFLLWKINKKTKFVDPATVDIWEGKAGVDAECAVWENGGVEENEKQRLAQMNIIRRTWERIW